MKWTKINHYLHPKICSACAILLMAGATLPQVADAETTYDRTSTVDLNYDRSNVLGFERMFEQHINTNYLGWVCSGFAPIFPDTCYHLTHYWPAAADIPV
ncbi:hypothetical protein NA664_21655, partial [Salmonella sp. NW328]